ncbi:MAG TPA: putative Ig domain-containing protein, partial [Leptospiraceae bacterium]|nr:putative Ig domain-containing protein [Leptospiraceae bacterium]
MQYLAGVFAVFSSPSSAAAAVPSSTYTGSRDFSSAVPGDYFEVNPGFTGQISSISLSPSTLPSGITFDSTTGKVSGTPALTNSGFPSTSYTITAVGPNGNVTFTFQLGVLASGANVWTKLIAGNGGHTYGTYGGLNYDPASGYLYGAGTTNATSLDSINNLESAGYNSGLIVKYSTSGIKSWTVLFGTDTPANININVTANHLDSAGNIYVSGVVWPSSATGTMNSLSIPNQRTLFITKYSSSGTRLWTAVKNSVPCTGGYLTVDSSGNSYVTGTVLSGGLDSFTNSA